MSSKRMSKERFDFLRAELDDWIEVGSRYAEQYFGECLTEIAACWAEIERLRAESLDPGRPCGSYPKCDCGVVAEVLNDDLVAAVIQLGGEK